MHYLEESKPFHKSGQTIKELYYPGATFTLRLPRNPIQPSLQFFVPNIILSIFILAACNIEGEFADMLGTVSLSLLTLVALYSNIRDAVPDTLAITYIEKIVMLYIFYCLVPVIDNTWAEQFSTAEEPKTLIKGVSSIVVWLIINFVVCSTFAINFVKQYKISQDREPPKQEKVAGDKRAADLSWLEPNPKYDTK
jgi:hypothetical protein